MKFIVLLIALISIVAQAKPLATGKAEFQPAQAQAHEVTVDGDVAQKIYELLDVKPSVPVSGPKGTLWINKFGKGIVCGQEQKTGEFACSITVNEEGIL